MTKNQIVLTVPADVRYTSTVESFTDIILPYLKTQDEQRLAVELRTSLNEAFVNVIRHSTLKRADLVEIKFELDNNTLIIVFQDKGPGISINGHYPPYPDDYVSTHHTLIKTIDGVIDVFVEEKESLLLTFKENDYQEQDPQQLLENARDGGMGLSLIVKVMDSVRFVYSEAFGNRLEITKEF